MKSTVLFVLFLTLFSSVVSAQQPEDIINTFFITFDAEGSGPALDYLYGTNPWMEQNKEAVSNLKTRMEVLTPDTFGMLHGYELFGVKNFADTYRIYTYMARYDRQPIRFIFQFYRPGEEWRVHGFRFDTDFEEEMEHVGYEQK